MDSDFRIAVVEGQTLPAGERKNIVTMCSRAFDEDLGPMFASFSDPIHVLGYQSRKLVSHALWLTRWLELNHNRMLRTAYVEAVATEEVYRRRGYASMIMRRVQKEIQGYHLGALSPFNVKFYERLGWELWRGPLFIRTEKGLIPSPTDEEVMIFRLPETPDLDLTAPLSVEWREGEVW